MTDHDLAIAHKDYDVAGGGEILAERLGLCFDAPVFTGYVIDENRADLRADVRGLWGDGLKGKLIKRGGVARQALYSQLWRRCEVLRDYDVVIQSGMEPLWYIPRDRQTTVAYCHAPPRMQTDLYPYLHDEPDNWREWLGTVVAEYYNDKVRQRMALNARYPDLWVCNSELVARRLRSFWNIDREDVRVVYPPIPTAELDPDHAEAARGDFYLSLNRLDDWKRVDEIIDAFAGLDQRLLVAGKGPAEDDLREQAAAHDNIEMLGFVSASEKRRLLASAKATVYNPLNEDFGMVPIESLASGTPVVSVRDGYQRYQLDDGRTAVLYDRAIDDRDATVRNLRAAVRRFEAEGVAADTDELVAEAAPYSVDRFNEQMRAAVDEAVERTAISADPAAQAVDATPQAMPDGGDGS